MPLTLRYRGVPGLTVAARDGAWLRLAGPDGATIAFSLPSEDAAADVAALAGPDGVAVERFGADREQGRLAPYLDRLRRAGLLDLVALDGTTLLAAIEPLSPSFVLIAGPPPDLPLAVDRFAHLRRTDRGAELASPDLPARLLLGPEAAAGVAAAMAGQPLSPALAELLWRTGLLLPRAETPDRQVWEFHDRLFHAATRGLGPRRPLGPTLRFKGRLPPVPAEAPAYPGLRIALPPPAEAAGEGLRLLSERRRSRRDQGEPPVALAQLATLLHRCLRIRRRFELDGHVFIDRPVPAGGGLGEIEAYLAVGRADGLAPGFYHYDAAGHALVTVADTTAGLLDEAAANLQRPGRPPQVLLLLTSRLPRLAWKYEAIAYRLTLLNAGVILQALALAAEDLGLAGCALGTGDGAVFHRLSGRSADAEVAVAEFCIGSRATN